MSSQINSDDILARLQEDFLEDARDQLGIVESYLGSMQDDGSDNNDMALGIRREVHNLKGMGGTFGFPSISLIAHLLEDYVASAEAPLTRHRTNISVFHDTLTDILNQGFDPGDAANTEIIRGLPVHTSTDVKPTVARDIDALLVIPSRSIAKSCRGRSRLAGSVHQRCGRPRKHPTWPR